MKSLAFAALWMVLTIACYACRCGDLPPIRDAVLKADAIVVGRVMMLSVAQRRVEGTNRYREVVECTLEITDALKGIERGVSRVVIITSSAGPACGYPFQIGDAYLVYARRESGELETDACTRTRPRVIIEEKPDLSDLSKIKADDAVLTEVPAIRAVLDQK